MPSQVEFLVPTTTLCVLSFDFELKNTNSADPYILRNSFRNFSLNTRLGGYREGGDRARDVSRGPIGAKAWRRTRRPWNQSALSGVPVVSKSSNVEKYFSQLVREGGDRARDVSRGPIGARARPRTSRQWNPSAFAGVPVASKTSNVEKYVSQLFSESSDRGV